MLTSIALQADKRLGNRPQLVKRSSHTLLLRVQRRNQFGGLNRPQWVCPINYSSFDKTIEEARSAVLRFNGIMEVWSFLTLDGDKVASCLMSNEIQ